MFYREAGQFKTSYHSDSQIFPIRQDRYAMAIAAIVGGLIIGASEKVAEVFLGPYVGGGIEGWFPYVLALLFLLVRPEGLFGEKIIRRI